MDLVIEDLYVEEVGGRVAGEMDAIELAVCAGPDGGRVRHVNPMLAKR
jgi:hypothetical protein